MWGKAFCKWIFFVLIFSGVVSCQNEDVFTVHGHIEKGDFDGEKIYLVPFNNPKKENVDSTVIKDGEFKFEKKIDDPSVFIIRSRPVLRLKLQELLVVSEPGDLKVYLGQPSRAEGTPLNDSLQHWKTEKLRRDRRKAQMKKGFENNENGRLEEKIDSLEEEDARFHYRFVKNNYDNVVGQFVYDLVKSSFSEKQIEELEQ